MLATPHPVWGRAIGTLDIFSSMIRLTVSAEDELTGKKALKIVAQAADEAYTPSQEDLGQLAYILDSSLRLAQDPRTIQNLMNPLVIKGCIRLLKAAVAHCRGDISPFRYEFGYLCFLLLVTSFNICLMEQCGPLNETLAACEEDEESATHNLIAMGVGQLVNKQFDILESGSDCDWALGWSIPSPNQQGTLLSPSEISTLLGLLWDNRIFMVTTSGLSGLLYIFLRHVFHQQHSDGTDAQEMQARLYELSIRYLLVAEYYHRTTAQRVIDACVATINLDNWANTPKHMDSEDSRLLMTAFIKRFTSGRDPKVFFTRDPSIMLRLISTATDEGSQDLLPDVIQWTIKYGGLMLLGTEENQEYRVQGTTRTLFGVLL